MGEAEDQQKEEPKAADQTKTTEKEDQDNKPAAKDEDEKKKKKKGADQESKKPDESPPPPPPEIVLKVYMHCEGCARKVRRCLQGCAGVEDVMTDCKSGKVVVKGEKADPLKLLDTLEKKTHRKVDLLSPIPKPPSPEEDKKTAEPDQQPAAKPVDDNKQEVQQPQPQVIIVVLKVYMHCEACAMKMKKRILKMKGVESAEPDLKSSQVSVKGVFEAEKLVEYILKRTGKHAAIVKQEPEKKEEQNKEEKKTEEAGGDDKDKKEGGGGEEAGKLAKEQGAGGDAKAPAPEAEGGGTGTEEISKVVNEVTKRNEYYYHPQRFNAMEMHSYPPQIFSDENPNACCVM